MILKGHKMGFILIREKEDEPIKLGLIEFLRGFRKCYECNKKFHKKDMNQILVPDGILDDRVADFCENCTELYIEKISKGSGIFSNQQRFAASGKSRGY